jgi:hypothetical protein
MNFIERLVGVSPDGGDGSLETLYLFVIIVVVCMFLGSRRLFTRMD